MSGAQTSTFADPNVLLRTLSGDQTAQVQRNQLLNQGAQQALNENEMEQISRASNWVISQDPDNKDPAKQAAAYGAAVKLLRANNFAKNAPEQYPGFDAMQMMARQGTPSAEQFKLGQAGTAIPTPGFETGSGAAPGGGDFSADKETARKQIVARESGGDPTALNYVAKADPTALARGATASGKYQFVNSTWREGLQLAGIDPAKYATARDAPEAVQDQVFDAVYAKYGTKPWQQGPKDWVKDEAGNYQLAAVRPPPGSPGGASVTAAAAPPGGGVVARNPGAVQVAGPGAGPPAAATAPAATPDLMGPRPLPPIGPQSPVVTPESLANTPAPQNALAPPPPAAPAAAPAPPAQPPAATAPPVIAPVAIPAPPAMDTHNLTQQDYQDLDRARRAGMTGPQLTQEVQQRQNANITRAHQYQSDVRQAQNDAQAANERAIADARAAEQLRLSQVTSQREQEARADAAEKAARERKLAADPIQGTDDKANADRQLFRYADKILDGSATKEERRLYAQGAQYYLKPQMQWISDSNDPTKSVMVPVPGQLPQGFPHPSYKPGEQPAAQPPAATKSDVKPLPENERKVLLETATRLDQLNEQRSGFKPEYGGFVSAAVGDFANAAARNNPIASKADTARAEWWQNYQRMKLAVRQSISGQSLTASELAEFDKADINPGMTPEAIKANLAHQDQILRTAHERRVASLAAEKYSPDAIRAASGLDPASVKPRPVESGPTEKPAEAKAPPGFKVIVP